MVVISWRYVGKTKRFWEHVSVKIIHFRLNVWSSVTEISGGNLSLKMSTILSKNYFCTKQILFNSEFDKCELKQK